MHAGRHEARLRTAAGSRPRGRPVRPDREKPGSGTVLKSDDEPAEASPRQHGRLRGFLKLMVEIDSSRFALSRIRAALVLLTILALFAGIGYGLPALLSQYF